MLGPVRASGLAADGLWGTVRHGPDAFRIHTDQDSLIGAIGVGDSPLAIVTSRTNDTELFAITALGVTMGPGVAMSVQNGLGNCEIFSSLGGARTVAGVLNTGVCVAEPGLVRVTVQGRPLQVGRAPVAGNEPEVEDWCRDVLAPHLAACGMPVAFAEDVRAEQWKKLAYNCALNAGATLMGGTYREYAAQPGALDDMRAVIREIYAVGAAAGVRLDPPTPEGYDAIFFGPGGWLERTFDHVPSMARQLGSNGTTEIESLNGAIQRLGASLGVPTPVNSRLADGIRRISVVRRRP
jgi:2-dehydropantoate 2-reductase